MATRPRPNGRPGRSGRRAESARPARRTTTTRRTTRGAAAPSSSAAANQPGSSSRAKLTGRAAILLLVVAVLGVSYAASIRAWLNQRDEISGLSAQIAATKAQNAELAREKQRWQDPAFVESEARLRFGWIMPGEKGYRVIGMDGKVLSRGIGSLTTPHSSATPEQPPWWQSLWGSVEQAGNPAAAQPAKRHPGGVPAGR